MSGTIIRKPLRECIRIARRRLRFHYIVVPIPSDVGKLSVTWVRVGLSIKCDTHRQRGKQREHLSRYISRRENF